MDSSVFDKMQELEAKVRQLFITRDVMFHDGRELRRFTVSGRTQALLAGVAVTTLTFSAYGVAQATIGTIASSGVVTAPPRSPQEQVAALRAQVERMQTDLAAAKQAAAAHAGRIEQQQAAMQALLSGQDDHKAAGATGKPIAAVEEAPNSAVASEVLAPLRQAEKNQLTLVIHARAVGEARYAAATDRLRRLGLSPERYTQVKLAMGGPFEPVSSSDSVSSSAATTTAADAQFRSLFQTWKKLDALEQTVVSIPSAFPVEKLNFTSNFGVRTDPFRGIPAMHPGVDIPGPIGTPVYATADGVVSRAGRLGGYGNMVEIDHGKGIATRYGHLSRVLVADNVRVRRGQLIGLMGSTGRSTGPHLHYEVRIDGRAVNPVPFLQGVGYVQATAQPAGAAGDSAG